MMLRSRKPSRATCALSLLLLLGACSHGQKDGVDGRQGSRGHHQQAEAGIVPSPAYAFHELRLDDTSMAALSSSTNPGRISWEVDGSKVHIGDTLAPTFLRAGSKVTAVVETPDGAGGWQPLARYSCVVKNSPPRVEQVELERDRSNPYHIKAVLRERFGRAGCRRELSLVSQR